MKHYTNFKLLQNTILHYKIELGKLSQNRLILVHEFIINLISERNKSDLYWRN